jgi:ABC-2 type transport system ATP-binding protein
MDTLMTLRSEGRTILFSTHRMDQVEKFCDGIALISRGRLVLSGSMRAIKSRYPRNRVQVAFTGSDAFLRDPAILEAKPFAGGVDLLLSSEAGAQQVLASAVAQGAILNHFEIHEPSLEEIFIEEVKKSFGETEAVEA